MRVIQVPRRHSNVLSRAQGIRESSLERIREFSKQKFIEHGLVSKTSTYVPLLSDVSTAELRKTVVKLRSIFARALEKQIPYVAHTEVSFYTVKDRSIHEISLKSRPITSNLSHEEFLLLSAGRNRERCLASSFGQTVSRYVRYLQFLCLKYALPLELNIRHAYTHISADQNVELSKMSVEQRLVYKNIEVQYSLTIDICLVKWKYANLREDYTESDPLEKVLEEILTRDIKDYSESSVFSAEKWSSSNFVGGRVPYSDLDRRVYERYWAIEKIFFFLPQIQTVLKTLTRKVAYVPSAFSIGTIESS